MGECIKFGRGKIELYKPKFADNSWNSIIAACQTDAVPDSWKVGDQKAMTINGADYLIDIIGRNHDDYSDGSGKAPLTFQMHDCYNTTYYMNASNSNSGGWGNCEMRNTHLPAILAFMPQDVQTAIKGVSKLTSAGSASATINTTSDKLFLLSEIEVFGSTTYAKAGEGKQYDYYAAGNSKVKKVNGSAYTWWERSPFATASTGFCYVSASGGADGYAQLTRGVAPAFCF